MNYKWAYGNIESKEYVDYLLVVIVLRVMYIYKIYQLGRFNYVQSIIPQ